jgi:anti-sigma-K factor RskA
VRRLHHAYRRSAPAKRRSTVSATARSPRSRRSARRRRARPCRRRGWFWRWCSAATAITRLHVHGPSAIICRYENYTCPLLENFVLHCDQ